MFWKPWIYRQHVPDSAYGSGSTKKKWLWFTHPFLLKENQRGTCHLLMMQIYVKGLQVATLHLRPSYFEVTRCQYLNYSWGHVGTIHSQI